MLDLHVNKVDHHEELLIHLEVNKANMAFLLFVPVLPLTLGLATWRTHCLLALQLTFILLLFLFLLLCRVLLNCRCFLRKISPTLA